MKLPIRLMLLIKLYAMLTSWTLAANRSSLLQYAGYNQLQHVPYPSSVADLIVEYFQNYKHIKQLTLFLCDGLSSSPIVSQPFQDDDVTAGGENNAVNFNKMEFSLHGDGDRRQTHASLRYLNFQLIAKHLMVTGNFLIKGDGNIDAKKFRGNDPFYVPDMLKCGDFKLGVVLDLRCRQSKFIFQQVTVSHQ